MSRRTQFSARAAGGRVTCDRVDNLASPAALAGIDTCPFHRYKWAIILLSPGL